MLSRLALASGLGLFISFAQAHTAAVCREGKLPSEFQGTYKTPSSNTPLILTKDRLRFQGFANGYLDLKSCRVQGRRIVTLTDSSPENTQNFFIVKLHNGNLQVQDLADGETQIWVRLR